MAVVPFAYAAILSIGLGLLALLSSALLQRTLLRGGDQLVPNGGVVQRVAFWLRLKILGDEDESGSGGCVTGAGQFPSARLLDIGDPEGSPYSVNIGYYAPVATSSGVAEEEFAAEDPGLVGEEGLLPRFIGEEGEGDSDHDENAMVGTGGSRLLSGLGEAIWSLVSSARRSSSSPTEILELGDRSFRVPAGDDGL